MRFATNGSRSGSGLWGRLILISTVLMIAPAAQAQLYSESVSGDLSTDPQMPTNVGTLGFGSNLITGETIPSGPIIDPATGARAVIDADYLTFTVGAGQRLTGLTFGAGTVVQPGDRLFLGIAQGWAVNVDPSFSSAAGLLGWTLLPASLVGTNLLPALGASAPPNFPPIPGATGFIGALGPGIYSLWLQDGDQPVTYSFNLLTTGVPEPSSWTMMIAGFGFFGTVLRRSRRRRVRAMA